MEVTELEIPEEVKEILIKNGMVKLYPPQEEALENGALEGRNIVLASPTASGKTLIAELCALKHILRKNGKVVYLTPLRALANEKYDVFKKYEVIEKPNGEKVTVALSTGDYDSSDPWLEKYDIIITTNEKMDSLLRHRAKWVDEVSLIVADEIHLLNDPERGPTLEVVLAEFMQINPTAQILALSATIKNVEEIAEWLNAKYVITEWRPVALKEGVLYYNEIIFKDGNALKIDIADGDPAINLAIRSVRLGAQALIFAGTRRKAVSLAKKAASRVEGLLSKPLEKSLGRVAERILSIGEQTRISNLLAELIRKGVAFHHAGLKGQHRRIIEDEFRSGVIKVLTATPTLAFGVNLPARTVIINDYTRYEPGYGRYPISVLEYKQMAGRAGRPKYDMVGEAILAAKTSDECDYLLENYVSAEPERIWSKLAVERILRAHVLATIASGFAKTEQGLYAFFKRTFYAHQYDPNVIKSLLAKILRFLYNENLIEVSGSRIHATKFGKRVSELYIDPVSGIIIRDSLNQVPNRLTEISYLHIIAHTPDMFPKLRPSSRELDKLAFFANEHGEEFIFEIPDEWIDRLAYEEFLAEVKVVWVLYSWINEKTEDELIENFNVEPGDLYRLIETAKWLLHATHELAALFNHKSLLPKISELMERVNKGVRKELIPLVRLEGIGRIRARILYDAGYRTLEGLKHASLEELMKLPLIGSKLAMEIKRQVEKHIKSG